MSDINKKIAQFCANIAELEAMVPRFADFYFDLTEELDDKDNVWKKLDANMTYCFMNTSLFWLYLTLNDTDLKDHPIKNEIERVRKYMQQYNLLKENAPKLNVKMAQSLIRHALWEPQSNDKNKRKESQEDLQSNKRSR